jgi:hypothetical protein
MRRHLRGLPSTHRCIVWERICKEEAEHVFGGACEAPGGGGYCADQSCTTANIKFVLRGFAAKRAANEAVESEERQFLHEPNPRHRHSFKPQGPGRRKAQQQLGGATIAGATKTSGPSGVS